MGNLAAHHKLEFGIKNTILRKHKDPKKEINKFIHKLNFRNSYPIIEYSNGKTCYELFLSDIYTLYKSFREFLITKYEEIGFSFPTAIKVFNSSHKM